MRRPRDSAFLPILPVAFLALQLASQHFLISKKTEITMENIKASEPAIPVLDVLWRESPQTLSQLYKDHSINKVFTMNRLQEMLYLLIDNKLVRTRKIENAETKYFYAIDRRNYDKILKKASAQQIEIPKLNTGGTQD
jgi:hypothetical protein